MVFSETLCKSFRIYFPLYIDIMDNCNSDQWDDYLIEPSDGRNSYLEEVRPPIVPNRLFISVTLNLPRTLKFLRATSVEQQKMYYTRWLEIVKMSNKLGNDLCSAYEYEFCKTGQIHLHGWLEINNPCNFFEVGFLSDIVKTYKRTLGRTACFMEKAYFPEWKRYKDPSICLQIETSSTRIEEWKAYIIKCKK